MRALGIILLAFLGGVIGYLVFAVVSYLVFFSIEGRDFEGGIAMGSAFVIGPVGAILGAVAGILVGLGKIGGNKADKSSAPGSPESNGPASGEPSEQAQDPFLPPGGRRSKIDTILDWQALAGIATIGAVMFGIWFFLFRDDTPASFPRYGPRPTAYFEVKVPVAAIRETGDFRIKMELHSVNNIITVHDPVKRRLEGEHVIFSGRIKLLNKTADRQLAVWLSPVDVSYFSLGLAKHPIHSDTYSQWQPVMRIEDRKTGHSWASPADAEMFIRTRATWGEQR